MKKVFLILASVMVLAAPPALAAVSSGSSGSSYGLSKEEIKRLEDAGKKVAELVKAGAPQEEIAAAAAEVQKIYDEFRAKSDAEIAKFKGGQ